MLFSVHNHVTFLLRLEQSFQHFLKKEQYVPEWEAFFCCSSLNVSFAWIFSSRAASCALAVLLWKAWGFPSQHLRKDFVFRELTKLSIVSKGHLTLKGNFSAFNYPKKMNLKMLIFALAYKAQKFPVCFWGELKKPKSPFEIN